MIGYRCLCGQVAYVGLKIWLDHGIYSVQCKRGFGYRVEDPLIWAGPVRYMNTLVEVLEGVVRPSRMTVYRKGLCAPLYRVARVKLEPVR